MVHTKTYIFPYFTFNIWSYLLWPPEIGTRYQVPGRWNGACDVFAESFYDLFHFMGALWAAHLFENCGPFFGDKSLGIREWFVPKTGL